MQTVTEEKEGQPIVPLTCQRCEHFWNYSGTNDYVAICPYCKTTVQIKKKVKRSNKKKLLRTSQRVSHPIRASAIVRTKPPLIVTKGKVDDSAYE
jgi:hypothetical protein